MIHALDHIDHRAFFIARSFALSADRAGASAPYRPARATSYRLIVVALGLIGLFALSGIPDAARAQEGATPPHWIWGPTNTPPGAIPAETRYFRLEFNVKEAGSRLTIDITADNAFSLDLDGEEIAQGDQWQVVKRVEATLKRGPHVLAVKASNEAAGAAGLLIRGSVLPLGQGLPIHSSRAWRVAGVEPTTAAWKKPGFDDSQWPHAVDLGVLGTGPWSDLTFESADAAERFIVPKGLRVTTVAAANVTGSVVSFAFDAAGRPCVGIERGPIAVLTERDAQGVYHARKDVETSVKNCQGFSFIRGSLYAVGDGPKGAGIYKLDDPDGDELFDKVELLRGSNGGMGEHGPHSIQLGPDGSLYYNCGNHAHLRDPIDPKSPIDPKIRYEGELLPHYDDARGHAAGIMAPGGEIDRSEDGGKTWSRIVAGFRNEYDFAFNRDGEIFSFDSDMEWDVGLPWYRPVRVVFCPPGAEFGWRNGTGKWPVYYFDSLKAVYDVGRGSPTGVTFYQGGIFPKEFDDSFIICDWSQGRILAVKAERSGGGYTATATELVTGRPLNCTDIEVGPDGGIYFTTGGRGTQGGLFRTAPIAERRVEEPADPIDRAIHMNSPLSSYSQAKLAKIKTGIGGDWEKRLNAIASDGSKAWFDRVRSVDLLVQFGPAPADDLLIALARDRDSKVREKAVAVLGTRRGAAPVEALVLALKDSDAFVRRRACEAIVRTHETIPIDRLIPLLSDRDRLVRYEARIAIEHGDVAAAREQLLSNPDRRGRIEGALAIVRATDLDLKTIDALWNHILELLQSSKTSTEEKLDVYRLIELTMLKHPYKDRSDKRVTRLIEFALGVYPTNDAPTNRELARILAYLGEPRAIAAILDHMLKATDPADQIHDALCLRVIREGWTDEQKAKILSWFETASKREGGFSFTGYLDHMIQDLLPRFSRSERLAILARGDEIPFPTRMLARTIDVDADPGFVQPLIDLFVKLGSNASSSNAGAVGELRAIVLETLGRGTKPEAHAALRRLGESNPAARDLAARALANHPSAADFDFFVAALESRDPNTLGSVLAALRRIDRKPQGADPLRGLIAWARRTGAGSLKSLNEIGSKWYPGTSGDMSDFSRSIAVWEKLYGTTYPNAPALADADSANPRRSYTLDQLVRGVLEGEPKKRASAARGKTVVVKARCLDCHKFGEQGQGLGPDLTTVSSRFRPVEILESIVAPSKVISDQYKPITIATTDGKVYNGMPTVAAGANVVLLLSDGTKTTIRKSEIEDQKESKISVMPEGLLDSLSLQEIADLLALFDSAPRVAPPSAADAKK